MPRLSPAPSEPAPGIQLQNVTFSYAHHPITQELNWSLPQGGSAFITGPPGCGKSTLLYLAAGLLPPQSGQVALAGHNVHTLLPSQRFHLGLRLGFVLQEGGLFANQSAFDNVTLALHYHADVLQLTAEDIQKRAELSLNRVELPASTWTSLPAHLSFGHRRRLSLARALAIEPRFFFFDDPDVGLDPHTAQLIHQLLCELRDDPWVTLVVGTQRLALMERLAIPAYQLEAGQLRLHVAPPLTSHSSSPSPSPPTPQ